MELTFGFASTVVAKATATPIPMAKLGAVIWFGERRRRASGAEESARPASTDLVQRRRSHRTRDTALARLPLPEKKIYGAPFAKYFQQRGL
jgi:hypothetical protein